MDEQGTGWAWSLFLRLLYVCIFDFRVPENSCLPLVIPTVLPTAVVSMNGRNFSEWVRNKHTKAKKRESKEKRRYRARKREKGKKKHDGIWSSQGCKGYLIHRCQCNSVTATTHCHIHTSRTSREKHPTQMEVVKVSLVVFQVMVNAYFIEF